MAEAKPLKSDSSSTSLQSWLTQPLNLYLTLDWEKATYLAIFLIGLVSRLWGVGDRAVSHDESLHTQYSYQYYNGEGYSHTPLMHGPFQFHMAALSYWLFGPSDFAARVPAAIFGLILIMLPYTLRDWLGRRGALFTSFLLLISPYTTYYSRYIREDVFSIVWAVIVFIATVYYLRDRKEHSLWWFSGSLALLFATKEVSFIYVAIYGSFLGVALLGRLVMAPWFMREVMKLRLPLVVIVGGLLLVGAGVVGKSRLESAALESTTAPAGQETFAVDPTATADVIPAAENAAGVWAMRWLQIAGLITFSMGLFLIAYNWQRFLEEFPEYDLIILYTTLVLPSITPILVVMAGWHPLDYNFGTCFLQGQENMSTIQLFFTRLMSGECWSLAIGSGLFRTGVFLVFIIIVSALVGTWWNARQWVINLLIFQVLFTLLYTSFFSNPFGWATGTIGSLGYWLEQHDVQRGSQPWFYYLFVLPIYEFLPIFVACAAVWLWAVKEKLGPVVRYWIPLSAVSLLAFSLSYWSSNKTIISQGGEPSYLTGVTAGGIVLVLGAVVWFVFLWPTYKNSLPSFKTLLREQTFTSFVPHLAWWFIFTALAYSFAGEKMPWLSFHFVIPLTFLGGWYFEQRLKETRWEEFTSRGSLLHLGLATAAWVMLFLAITPWFTGQLANQDGNQILLLQGYGRFFGSLVVFGVLVYVILKIQENLPAVVHARSWVLSFLFLLSLLTIRFSYMASFPNADYVTEYLVYAHGAPATKQAILAQLEEISLRMYGDKSIRVSFDNESAWPYTWYLRDYPNRNYIGENPTPDITNSPVLIIGNANWHKVDPLLRDQYEYQTYTFLWWPMEEYRQISWDAVLGDSTVPAEQRKGIFNPDVRQALWNIFFYRDYTKYGEVFSRSYNLGEWPLRDEVRIYIRKDVLPTLWDKGVGVTFQPAADPYEQNELQLQPEMQIGIGELNAPRNVAIAPNGDIYVADSGNHRIAIFDQQGQFVDSFGGYGTIEGQLNEPWGLAVDEEFVYVADTWNHRVQKFTLDGTFVLAFGQSGTSEDPFINGGIFFGPRAIALLSDNRLAVTDTGNHRIQIFDREGNFIRAFGGLGNEAGKFYEPVGLTAGGDGNLLVADTWNNRVQQLDSQFDFFPAAEWPFDGWASQSIDNKPYLAVDDAGRVYLTDPEGYRVVILSPEGEYLGWFGSYVINGVGLGLPIGISLDAENNIYVVDSRNNMLVKFPAAFPPVSDEEESEPAVIEESESEAKPSPTAEDEE